MLHWLKQHKREIFRATTTLVVVGLFVFVAPEANAQSILSNPVAWFLSIIASVIEVLVGFVSSVLVLALKLVQVILQYNDFIGHPVVQFGWEIVRNLANTGLVAIMLIIAFMTMFGIGKVQWQQQIPRLIIAAIAVNFSRLITGIFIDIGQVIMNAFVNALQQVGYANFFEMLQLRQQTQLTGNPEALSTSAALALVATALFALLQAIIALIVIAIMVAVLLYRIVILWVLVVMSPAAFAAGAAQGMLSQAGGFYQQWWGKLTAAVMIGPVLAFFLWLSLASVSSGLTAGFETDLSEETPGSIITNQSANTTNLLTYVIGIALLLAGLEIASQTAGQLGGFAQRAVSGGAGLSKKIAGAPIAIAGSAGIAGARLGGRVVKKGARAGIELAADQARGRTANFRQYARTRLGTYADRAIAGGGVGAALGRGARSLGGRLNAAEERERKRLQQEEAGFGKTMSLQERLDYINKNKGAGSARVQSRVASLRAATASNKDQMAELLNSNPAEARKLMADAAKHYKDTGQDDKAKGLDDRMKRDLRLAHGDAGSMQGAIEGMSDRDLKNLDASNFTDANFRKAMADSGMLEKFFEGDDADQKQARKGYNKKFLDAAKKAYDSRDMDDKEVRRMESEAALLASGGPGGNLSADEIKRRQASNNATHALMNGLASGNMNDVLKSGINLADIDLSTLRGQKDAAGNDLFDESKLADALAEALSKSGSASAIKQLQDTRADASDPQAQARAMSMMNLLTGAAGGRNLVGEMNQKLQAGTLSGGAKAAAQANMAMLSGNARSYNFNTAGAPGTFASPADRQAFVNAVAKTPEIILNMETEIANDGPKGDLSSAITQSMTKESLDGFLKDFEKARGSASEGMRREVVQRIGKMIEDHKKALVGATDVSDDIKKQMDELSKHYNRRVKNQLV